MSARRRLLAIPLLAAACSRPPADLAIEHWGCAELVQGPKCLLSAKRALVVWVETTDPREVRFEADGRPLSASASPAGRGTRFMLVIPPGARALEMLYRRRLGRLALGDAPSEDPRLARAQELRNTGAFAEAAAIVRGVLAEPQVAPDLRARALGLAARIERARGDDYAADQLFDRALDSSRAAGLISNEIRDRMAYGYGLLTRELRYVRAENVIEEGRTLAADLSALRAETAYYLALVARETADLSRARALTAEAAEWARRFGDTGSLINSRHLEATMLQAHGRFAEAAAVFREIFKSYGAGADACLRAAAMTNLGWALVLDRDRVRHGREPIREVAIALEMTRRACTDRDDLENALANAALEALGRGDFDTAALHLEDAHPKSSGALELWWIDIDARLAIARGEHQRALERYQWLDLLAQASSRNDTRRVAATGKGAALEALGRIAQAIEAHRAADRLTASPELTVPILSLSDAWVSPGPAPAIRAAELLLREHRDGEALELLRSSWARSLASAHRMRSIQSIDLEKHLELEDALAEYRRRRKDLDDEAAEDWKLDPPRLRAVLAERTQEIAELDQRIRAVIEMLDRLTGYGEVELRAPREGEAMLFIFRLGGLSTGFALGSDRSLSVHPQEGEAPQAIAASMIAAFAPVLGGASTLRIVTDEHLRGVDFHTLELDGRPLLERWIVSYGVDAILDVSPSAPVSSGRRRSVVIFGEGTGEHDVSREETGLVCRIFASSPHWTGKAWGDELADRAAVLSAIKTADVFHFTGHRVLSPSPAGDFELAVSPNLIVDLQDLLRERAYPRSAIFFDCGDHAERTIDLGNALLEAGTREAIVVGRPVSDPAALMMAETLHRIIAAQEAIDLAAALRDAQLELRGKSSAIDWAAFRALGR